MHHATIDYATSVGDDLAIGGWLRRAVGWASVLYGGMGCASQVWFVAVSRNWIESSPDFGSFSLVQNTIALTYAAALALTCVGGAMVLLRRAGAIGLLRIALALAVAVPYVERTYDTLHSDMGWSWRSLGVGWTLANSVLPAMLLILTFGPPGRAIRRTLIDVRAA